MLQNNNFEDNLNFVNVIESDDENVNKSEDYFNFESSDSELDDTNNEKSEINETNEKFSISKIWDKLIDTKDLHGYESKQSFYHLTNLKIFKKLKDL